MCVLCTVSLRYYQTGASRKTSISFPALASQQFASIRLLEEGRKLITGPTILRFMQYDVIQVTATSNPLVDSSCLRGSHAPIPRAPASQVLLPVFTHSSSTNMLRTSLLKMSSSILLPSPTLVFSLFLLLHQKFSKRIFIRHFFHSFRYSLLHTVRSLTGTPPFH